MSATSLKIDLRRLPEEGVQLAGTEPESFFQLTGKEGITAIQPLEYELHAVKDDGDLVVTGRINGQFRVECGRCLQPVEIEVDLDPYEVELEIPREDETMDLTEALREDILLALPSYPRCEDGNVEPRECPAEGRFDTAPEANGSSDEPTPSRDQHVWEVLDQLKNR
jgi:uncharacterized protein